MWYFTLLCTYSGLNLMLLLLNHIDVTITYPSLLLIYFIISLLNCGKIEENMEGVVVADGNQASLAKVFCVTVKFI